MSRAAPSLHDIAAVAARLPPFPGSILKLLALLDDEQSSIEIIGRIVRGDPVLSGNVLSLANHMRRLRAQPDLTDPLAAASLIGLNHVRRITLAASVNRYVGSAGSDFFFHHSFAVAIAAQELALLVGVSPDIAYVAGILHDVGQLCFQLVDDAAFQRAYLASVVDGRLVEREAETFGMDHCEIGVRLARHWNLPEDVVSAIGTHHDDAGTTSKVQAVVCIAETMARGLDLPPSPKNRVTRINTEAMALLGLRWDEPEMLDCYGRCRARYAYGTRGAAPPP